MTTTATLNFDQPTLFREGRFSREDAPAPRREPEPPRPASEPVAPPTADAPRGPVTLDDILTSAWDGLAAHHSVTCPVCSGSMAPRYGSGAQPVGGRCRRCGSTLG
jgi:hypothetical protein